MRNNFIFSLIGMLVFQIVLQIVLVQLGFNGVWLGILFDLILALFFTLLDFRGREKLRNPAFHKTLVLYFIVLTIISLLFGGYY